MEYLTHEEIKKFTEKGYTSGQVNREEAADDNIFYWITHWSGDLFEGSNLPYKGEFDLLRKAGRSIIADLKQNEVSADFEPIGNVSDGADELIKGKYLDGQSDNSTIEAFQNADQEIISCGHGAWELYTEYETLVSEERNQVLKRRPIPEANNVVFWDPDAILKDKSDADWVAVLKPKSEDGYKDLVHELTGEKIEEINLSQFQAPEHSYTFPWITGEGEKIYVGKFYHRQKTDIKYITFQEPLGDTRILEESKIEDVKDELADSGFRIISEKTVESYKVSLYIVSGEKILKRFDIAGPNIPIVSEYGERAIVEGEEHYEGLTRLAKGPQILRDFILSYLVDTVSRSPRPKDVYYQEQLAGYEDMYEVQGADDNLPYALMNIVDVNGTTVPPGPVGKIQGHEPPAALGSLVEICKQAVADVADSGLPENISEVDLSGRALAILEAKLDKQSMTFQENRKVARRRDAEIAAGMYSVILDTQREETIRMADGTHKKIKVMEEIIDRQSGMPVVINDVRDTQWKIITTIGPNYKSQLEATIDGYEKSLAFVTPGSELQEVITLKILVLRESVDKDVVEYARKKLILMGAIAPETDEEKAMLAQSQQQPKQPDAAMVLAQAEDKKGQADMLNAQREGVQMNLKDENDKEKNRIDMFKAETERKRLYLSAQEAGAKITKAGADTTGVELDNQAKFKELSQRNIEEMSTDDLFKELMTG